MPVKLGVGETTTDVAVVDVVVVGVLVVDGRDEDRDELMALY